jgi:type I restriction enzyme S subunit
MENKVFSLDKTGWEKVNLGKVVYEPKEISTNPVKEGFKHVVGLEHIDSEEIQLTRSADIDTLGTFTKKFKCGDLLFGRRRAYLKKAARANFDGICSGDITVMRAMSDLLPELLPFVINNERFFNYAIKHSAGSLSPRVKFKDLSNYEFLLPPKDEQTLLAKLFWSLNDLIESRLRTLENLDQLYIVKIEKQLLSKGSKKISIGGLGKVIRGVGFKPDDLVENYSAQSCLILRSNNIYKSRINFDDAIYLPLIKMKSDQLLHRGDYAICMSNGSKELVGKVAPIEDASYNIAVGSFCAGYRPNNEFNYTLLGHFFRSNTYRNMIKSILSGSAINNLKPSDIEGISIGINENNIDKLLKDLDLLRLNIQNVNDNISELKKLQKSLINQFL